jgi:hypothetical protein
MTVSPPNLTLKINECVSHACACLLMVWAQQWAQFGHRAGGTSACPPPAFGGRDPSQPRRKIKKALPRLLFEMNSMENSVQS